MSENKIRFRHIRVTETVRDDWGRKAGKFDHVLTLATRLEGDKLYIGYALNRVEKVLHLGDNQDRFDPEYGRTRATGRLNSNHPLVVTVHPDKPMIDSIVQGLLALPTEGSESHKIAAIAQGKDIREVPAVPSALKNLLKKSIREYNSRPRIEG